MARIQYRPSAQRRGFNPQQLSTEGISRMREESNRIIQGLQENRIAEARQRELDRQAMEDNAAYQQRMFKENFEIEQQNLRNQQQQALANIQGEQQQIQSDTTAAATVLDSLVDFSATLQKESARRTKQMIEDQTEIGKLSVQALDPQRLEEYIRAENARVDGTIAQIGEISANAVESNEDRLETIKNLVGIPGLSGYALQGALNQMAVQLYGDTLQSRLINPDIIFTSSTGNQFTGIQASRDVRLSSELQQQTKRDVLKFLNITEPLQVREGLEDIDKYNESITTQVRKNNLEDQEEEIRQKISLAEQRNNVEGFTIGFQARRSAFGLKAAHDGLENLVGNPNISLEEIKKVKIDGKLWYQNWANRWQNGLAERNKAISSNFRLERQLLEEEDKAWVRASLPSIQQAYDQNPTQAALLVKKRYLDKGMAIPQAIRNIETAAFAKNKAEVEAAFEERQRYGILDLPFVNNIQDPVLQKKARAAYDQQQLTRYGPETLGIKKGLKATARKLTKVDPNEEQGSATTFLVNARLENEYLKQLQLTNDPLKALENINKMVDEAYSGIESSPFYFQTGQNNRLVFPNIQTSDREVQERNEYIDRKLISGGAAVAEQPYTLATQDEMDATYQSSLSGITQYPPGVLRVADQLGLKPSEVYNAQRAANNATSGANKPLLAPSNVADLIDAAPPAMRKLFLSDVDAQVRRGNAMLTGQLPRRSSMGGSNPTPRDAYDYMRSLGVSDIHAKGILANIAGESNFQTDVMGDNGMSGGLFQMYNDRYRKMERAVPDWRTNWRGQIEHALKDDTAPQYLQMRFNSPEEAADWFLENYERPAMEHRPGRRKLNRTFIPNLGF